MHYVVHFKGKLPADCPLPIVLSYKINMSLKAVPTSLGPHVISTHWNPIGNLILTFSPATSHELIASHLPTIFQVLGLGDDHTLSCNMC